MPKPLLHPTLAALACALSALPCHASGGDLPIWPPPTVPPGANSAVIPAPRDDWMDHFERCLADARHNPANLIFDGDSITDYWHEMGRFVWAKHYEKLGSINFGISADKTENLLWRLADGQMDGLRPQLVAILIGANNLPDNSNEQIIEAIGRIVAEYRRRCPDALILLQGIFPEGEKADDPLRGRIRQINGSIARFGDGKQVLFLDFGDRFLQPDGSISKDIMPDAVHPSAKGYEIWAAAIQSVIDRVFAATPQNLPATTKPPADAPPEKSRARDRAGGNGVGAQPE